MGYDFSKKRKSGERFGRVFWRTLFSYISILILPLLIGSFYYIPSYSEVKERTQANERLILENFGRQVDAVFRDTINLGSHLQLNPYVIALSNDKATLDSTSEMDRYYLKKALTSLQISNAMLRQTSVYFCSSDYIVTTTSTHKRQLLSYMEKDASALSWQDWENILDMVEDKRIFCYAAPGKNFLTIVQVLVYSPSGEPLSVLAIQIDQKKLTGQFQERLLLEYPCAFSLICPEGVLVTAGEAPDIFSAPFCRQMISYFAENEDKNLYETESDIALIIDGYETIIPDTVLIMAAESKGFHAQTAQLLKLLFLTIAACLLVGLIVVLYYSRKNYEPVSHIMNFLTSPEEPVGSDVNEYHYIMNRLIRSRNEITHQRELLKSNYLQKIFSGEISVSQISEQVAEQLSLGLSNAESCVVLLSVNDPDEPGAVSELTGFIIRNVFQELLSEYFHDSCFCTQKQEICVLIGIPVSLQNPLSMLEQAVEKLIDFLDDSFQISVHAGISSCMPGEEIPDARIQADMALEYQRLFDTGHICLYDSIPQKQIIGSIPLNTSEYVINLVTQCSIQQISDYFSAIKKELARSELSLNDAKSCYYFFYQATARLQLHCQSCYGYALSSLDFLSEEFFAQSLSGALSQTCSAYQAASKELAQHRQENAQKRWGEDICHFIENNYFDANLNLNSIAESFGMSPTYLSRKFREEYHKSVIDQLYEVRIANSLALLTDTNMKISDIAQVCGFINSGAFIRIFKKYKGITPGRYKETGQ